MRKSSTTTSLTSSQNPATSGHSITLTASILVTSPGAGTPTGTVTFHDGTKVLGTSTVKMIGGIPQATLTSSSLSVGRHSIIAVYAGSTNYNSSTSAVLTQTINAAQSGGSTITPFDVNGDGIVSPLDALMIINQLNSKSTLTTAQLSAFDVNHDDQVTPLDALTIINYLINFATQQATSTQAVESTTALTLVASPMSTEAVAFALSTSLSARIQRDAE